MAEAMHETNPFKSHTADQGKWGPRIGWVMSGLMIAFMAFDGISKLALERHVIASTTAIGYPVDVIRPLEAVSGERIGLSDAEWAVIGLLLPSERGR